LNEEQFCSTPIEVTLDRGCTIPLIIWDTAGQEGYKYFVPMFARGASVAVVVFDLSNSISFAHVPSWITFLHEQGPEECRIVIVGNKSDLLPPAVSENEIESLREPTRIPFFRTSALTTEGVDLLFYGIAELAAEEDQPESPSSCPVRGNGVAAEKNTCTC
jgi:small GTP-binding protein